MSQTAQYFMNERREIAPLLPERIDRALELGCGAGNTMRWIRAERQVGFAAAVELFPDAARQAEQVFDKVIVGDAVAGLAALDERNFDLVLALDVLEHLTDPERAVDLARERMADGGRFVASLPHVGHFSVAMPLAWRGAWDYADEGLLDRTHLRFFSERSARALFADRGFEIERMEYVRSFPNLFSVIGLEDRKGRWYSQRLLEKSPWRNSHLLKFQFLIAARRR